MAGWVVWKQGVGGRQRTVDRRSVGWHGSGLLVTDKGSRLVREPVSERYPTWRVKAAGSII